MNSGLEAGRRTQPRGMSEGWKSERETEHPDESCVWFANEESLTGLLCDFWKVTVSLRGEGINLGFCVCCHNKPFYGFA